MKKPSLWERTKNSIKYQFDRLLSKGPITTILLLFGVTLVVVLIIGIIASLIGKEHSLAYEIWNSFMHALDAGNLAGNDAGNLPYLLLMTLATICGLFITSTLIGLIASWVEEKFNSLRKGISDVQESGHIVIIGFNDNTFTILHELIEANSNHKKACVVVLGEEDKERMEETIASRIADTRTTHIICRSGSTNESYSLQRCAVEKSRSVIINLPEDDQTIKCILAMASYLRQQVNVNPGFYMVASIKEKQHVEAARIAGEQWLEVVYAKDAISRVIAHTCRQHGLSQVLTEILNFGGNELYLETVPPAIAGKTFQEAMLCFDNAVLVGLAAESGVVLNPDGDTVIEAGSRVVLLEEDDGSFTLSQHPNPNRKQIVCRESKPENNSSPLIILGSNDKLPMILREYSQYVEPGCAVTVVDDDLDPAYIENRYGLTLTTVTQNADRALLCRLLEENKSQETEDAPATCNILLLNDDSQPNEASDSTTLLRLILLRDIAEKNNVTCSITTEMCNGSNQRLASCARVDDFVIGANFVSLLMSQIAENHEVLGMINELLDDSGSEFYMKPAVDYITPGERVNGYTLAKSAAKHNEVFVGYRLMSPVPQHVIINPKKSEEIVFGEKDLVVVIARG